MEGKSMIELVDGYYIEVDPLCYTLKKQVGTDKKGKPTYKVCGYMSSIKSCVKRCIDLIQREKLSEGIYTLTEALKVLESGENEVKQLLKKAIKEMEDVSI